MGIAQSTDGAADFAVAQNAQRRPANTSEKHLTGIRKSSAQRSPSGRWNEIAVHVVIPRGGERPAIRRQQSILQNRTTPQSLRWCPELAMPQADLLAVGRECTIGYTATGKSFN